MSEPDIVVVGLSHHTAPVHVRERLSVATDAMPSEVARLVGALPLDEAVVISTCNRVEIYAATTRPAEALTQARAYLVERGKPDTIDTFLYAHHGERAVAHAFRVAASLDSMVLGEPQILGQVKDAVAVAATAGTLGPLLGQCFRNAFSVAKRVRRETEIAAGTVSISSIAIELASKIFGTLEARKVLLVGAGKMGEAAAKALSKRGAELAVVNRSPERAQSVAQAAGGRARPFEALAEELAHADVVITSTGSPTFIVGVDSIRGVMRIRKGRPLFIIDIAVPRDVDPRVGEIDNVFVYDVDDLRKVADDNLAHRRKEASSAERIVHEEVQTFETWRASLAVTPTIVALRSQFQRVAELELERAMTRLGHLGPDDRQQVEAAVGRVVP
ncbi:MAG: glutamyl-tRNA reductase, partial [Myxococcales bacterium]|nr:glutamyl-tRNA reductase [Myxococcales bacterium]